MTTINPNSPKRGPIIHSESSNKEKKKQEDMIRLANMSRVYEHADRVLSGDPIKVKIVETGHAPAWSDGVDIFINKDMIDEFDIKEIVQITGLNYHELAHQLYTPRRGTTLIKWVEEQHFISDNYIQSFNILEDQRIETLMVARYPAIAPYLTALVVRWVGLTSGSSEVAYAAMSGRRYLPVELREAFRDIFIDPSLVPIIQEICDKYRNLAFPRDYKEGQKLIKRFKEEVIDKLIDQGYQLPNLGGCTDREPIKNGRPDNGKKQEQDSTRAEKMGTKESEFSPPQQEPSNSGSGNETGSSNTNNPMPSDEEPKSDKDGNVPNTSGGFTTGAHDESTPELPDNISELLDKINSHILSNNDVQTDSKAKQKAIIGYQDKHSESINQIEARLVPVPQDVLAYSRRFARELERLRQEAEPEWIREVSSGRVNIQRYLRNAPLDELFDRWDEGNDGTDMEVVILLDRSGSMGADSNDLLASQAMWVIKRALESIEVPVTVYAFDTQTDLVFNRGSKANRTEFPYVNGRGGTDPNKALLAAERLLKVSTHKSKLLFLITDGEFMHRKNDDIVKRMRSMGVITVITLIANDSDTKSMQKNHQNGSESDTDFWHDCEIFGNVNSASDLIPFAKSVVTTTIKRYSNK